MKAVRGAGSRYRTYLTLGTSGPHLVMIRVQMDRSTLASHCAARRRRVDFGKRERERERERERGRGRGGEARCSGNDTGVGHRARHGLIVRASTSPIQCLALKLLRLQPAVQCPILRERPDLWSTDSVCNEDGWPAFSDREAAHALCVEGCRTRWR